MPPAPRPEQRLRARSHQVIVGEPPSRRARGSASPTPAVTTARPFPRKLAGISRT